MRDRRGGGRERGTGLGKSAGGEGEGGGGEGEGEGAAENAEISQISASILVLGGIHDNLNIRRAPIWAMYGFRMASLYRVHHF